MSGTADLSAKEHCHGSDHRPFGVFFHPAAVSDRDVQRGRDRELRAHLLDQLHRGASLLPCDQRLRRRAKEADGAEHRAHRPPLRNRRHARPSALCRAAQPGVNVREDVQALDFIDLCAINPVVYSPNHYFTVGEHLGKIGDYAK
jgi:hypothetical protein